MKPLLGLIVLAIAFSSCAPGAFSKTTGVPLSAGQRWTLETQNLSTKAKTKLDFTVDSFPKPAVANTARANSYIIGSYIVTYPAPVTGLEWLELTNSSKPLLFTAGTIRGMNFLSVDIDRSSLDQLASCDFDGWKYGDTVFEGALSQYVITPSGSYSPRDVGICTLSLK
jgi:hypothetical protein